MENMSAIDNILTSAFLLSDDKKAIIETAEKLLKQVGIDEALWDKFPSQLSGGEAQRVGIVRALVNNPKVLFADEPTGALNSASGNAVLDVMTSVYDGGQSVICVTHDLKTAARGNRILYLRDGSVIGELNLAPYSGKDTARTGKLQKFLDEMGW
jgi:putative ABC transport system ATP-binding protein